MKKETEEKPRDRKSNKFIFVPSWFPVRQLFNLLTTDSEEGKKKQIQTTQINLKTPTFNSTVQACFQRGSN